ncbi:hypothetical protein DXG01_003313 [Tephrocybe rancida]|nr:hypothetical protein DXG01_003313 [Tephrocybe rancida]
MAKVIFGPFLDRSLTPPKDSAYEDDQQLFSRSTMNEGRILSVLATLALFASTAYSALDHPCLAGLLPHAEHCAKIKPKVFIFSLYSSEGAAWYGIPEFDVLAQNITIPGLSPLFPDAHCTSDGAVCQLTTGEAEINAAITITSLLYSPVFDLSSTYFLIAGVAGVNPKHATIGSVTFARFAVQVALQYEFDARDKPDDHPTGYVPQGSQAPWEYPHELYGTEVYEVNDALRKRAVAFARTATLFDSEAAQARRANYAQTSIYAIGAAPPAVEECDTATSDNYWSGDLLSEAFENTTSLFTNGTGVYCTSQQEDNAILAAIMRATSWGAAQYSRIIVMRSASDFDRPYEGQSAADNLFTPSPGYAVSLENTYRAGVKVVQGILEGWEETFEQGIPTTNRMGDVFGPLREEPQAQVTFEEQAVLES